jgi:hypothetical protein
MLPINQNQNQNQYTQVLENEYVNSLTPIEHQAYLIAKSHLGSLFTVSKTNGFIRWMKENKTASSA